MNDLQKVINLIDKPYIHAYNTLLQSIRVVHNGNGGRTLVGDEVHRLLSNKYRDQLIQILSPYRVTNYIFDNGSYDTAKQWIELLSKLHHTCMKATSISQTELNELKTNIDSYSMLRSAHIMDSSIQPMRPLTPKEHILLCHFYSFAQQHQTVGLLSEHGMEAQHSQFNRLHKQFSSITNKTQYIIHVMKQHLLSHNDQLSTVKRKPRICPKCTKPIAKNENIDYCICSKRKKQRIV
jgi:hypothetical protein